MAENATKQRAQSNAEMQECIREINRYRVTPNPSMRLLKQKLDKLNNAKGYLLKRHYAYAEKHGIEIDSEELLNWITPKLDEANDLADFLFVTIDDHERTEEIAKSTTENNVKKTALIEEKRTNHKFLQFNVKGLKT